MSSRLANAEAEIKRIFDEAEAHAEPLRAKVERLKIAIEEIQEAGHAEDDQAVRDVANDPESKKPVTAKQLILEELRRFNQPMTKLDFVAKFLAAGHMVNPDTVGSTLSIMRGAGILQKDAMNRYNLREASPK